MKTNENGSLLMRILRFVMITLLLGFFGCSSETGERVALYEGEFVNPESVVHDAKADRYLVSNINGEARAIDGNGFISRIDPNSGEIDFKWIDGQQPGIELNGPKGLAISGRSLIVADITVLRIFDLDSRRPLAQIPVEGSFFLNDVVAAPDGTIYVSDSGNKGKPAVYRIQGDQVTTLAEGASLGRPNGLFLDEDVLWVADFGSNRINRLSSSGSNLDPIELPSGKLDGIASGSKGETYVASVEGKSILVVEGDGSIRILASGLEAPADIGFDRQRARVLVPLLFANQVVALMDTKE
jgi:DNA-binding beta-propeller fold protein YncE